tara:strand:+ start:2184 stop:4010 length:1827 start_codon:yes stop_codon:yes gene_type:complete
MSGVYNMPTDGREHIDEVLADRNRGDRRVPTPVVEGTGKRDGGDLSHRGQDEKDLTIGEETIFQTAAVSPELEEYANAKGRQQTLDRDIAELEKASGAMKDELEAQIAGKYKPQNIHHGQKKETRQSDLLETEAEKLKSLDSILKRLDVLKDRQSSFDEEENTDPKHAEAVKKKKKIWDKARREGIGMTWDDKLEKAHKSKYTSWNRMDSGVRNEHRNTLGLSSIADYDQLSSADQKKVKDAGFWKENLKEQPIKEGTHFGDTGSTPELQAEKRSTEKPKPKTGQIGTLRRKRRLGKSLSELVILTQVVKLASGDSDLERVQHKVPSPFKPERGTAATSSLKPEVGESQSPWKATPQKPQQSGAGGALPKTTGRGAAANTASPKQGTGTGNQGILSQGSDKKDYEIDPITRKKIPEKKDGKLGKLRERAGKKLGTAKEKLEGFVGGYQKKEKPQGGGADKKIDRVTPHKTSTQGSSSGDKSPAEPEKKFTPRAGRSATEAPTDNDPTRQWNKEERDREGDDVPFKREEGEKPEEKTEKKPEPKTGKMGSTRRGRNKKPTYNPAEYIKMRKERKQRYQKPTTKKPSQLRSTRRGRGGGKANYQDGDKTE